MTAIGYTPDRRCYKIFDDGQREEINETHNIHLNRDALYERLMLSISKIVKRELNKMRVQGKGRLALSK